jgi:type I restriction-modification system DNA methylase subunit
VNHDAEFAATFTEDHLQKIIQEYEDEDDEGFRRSRPRRRAGYEDDDEGYEDEDEEGYVTRQFLPKKTALQRKADYDAKKARIDASIQKYRTALAAAGVTPVA